MLSTRAITRVVQEMCSEVAASWPASGRWRKLSELELWREVALGVLSSQSQFELASAAADALVSTGAIELALRSRPSVAIAGITRVLSGQFEFVDSGGRARLAKVRFPLRSARLVSRSCIKLSADAVLLGDVLRNAEDASGARSTLIGAITGFGPKQASMFLRRVGFSDDLAILDVHLLDFLSQVHECHVVPRDLQSLSSYERVESDVRGLASEYGTTLGILDFAAWITVRTAKREGLM